MRNRLLLASPFLLLLVACAPEAAPEPQASPPASAPTPAAAPQPEETPKPAAAPSANVSDDSGEACGQIVVVAYAGAQYADAKVVRDKAAAGARADMLLATYREAGDFPGLARTESDAPTSAARSGIMGTYREEAWPELHAALREPLFKLAVGAVAEAPIEAPYGYVLLRRCKVEKVHSRHILVRYAGAKNAGGEITRSKAEAKARAEQLLAELDGGADFAAVAKRASDDSSAQRGGDIGLRGRGLLEPPYEAAAFALAPGARSSITETDFGFHIIERLPNAAAP